MIMELKKLLSRKRPLILRNSLRIDFLARQHLKLAVAQRLSSEKPNRDSEHRLSDYTCYFLKISISAQQKIHFKITF